MLSFTFGSHKLILPSFDCCKGVSVVIIIGLGMKFTFHFFILTSISFILSLGDLRHRMVGRTVAIGDPCPWVAQSAEAFLSKIFACSYSIAGCAVISGNPADHFVHRHTHRVTRGTLLVCGRPDGRLSALTSLEASTCLAVNQASSIQSIGGTCESITIGHNNSVSISSRNDMIPHSTLYSSSNATC